MPHFSAAGFLALLLLPVAAAAQSPPERIEKFRGASNAPLEGSLMLPASATGRKSPAVLLIQGSGPLDRNGNAPPDLVGDMLKQFAQALAEKGIASFRYDKRGFFANSDDLPKKDADIPDYLSWENIGGDAIAAFRHLAVQPEIDADRVAVFGHSEGAYFALLLAKDLGARGPAAMVLAGAPALAYDKLAIEQFNNYMTRAGTSDADREKFNTEHRRVIEHIRQIGKLPEDADPSFGNVYPFWRTKFLQSSYRIDPTALAKAYTRPVVILHGAADMVVAADPHVRLYVTALAERTGGIQRSHVFDKVNHHFRTVESPTDNRIAGPLPADVATAFTDFLARHLGAGR